MKTSAALVAAFLLTALPLTGCQPRNLIPSASGAGNTRGLGLRHHRGLWPVRVRCALRLV